MKTNRILLLLCVAAASMAALGASAAMRGSPMMGRPAMAHMGRPAMAQPTPRFTPGNTMMGTHRFFNDRFHRFHRFNDGDFDRDDRFRRFHRFHNETFVFVDTFGFPFFFPYPFYPYPYYGYTPYGYYGYGAYGYGSTSAVVEVQRRLARTGYYHGRIDGIMGPQTRRAIRAYERHHNMRAYGLIDRRLVATLGLA